MKAAKEKTASALDAVDPNLAPFRSRGGKLILYHGWNDPAIPALNTVNYYQEVIGKLGRSDTDSFARLYMVPGMQHCAGGPGADVFGQSGTWPPDPQRNARTALETWVEKGTAPGEIIATKTASMDRTAMHDDQAAMPVSTIGAIQGQRRPEQAENFVCAAAKK